MGGSGEGQGKRQAFLHTPPGAPGLRSRPSNHHSYLQSALRFPEACRTQDFTPCSRLSGEAGRRGGPSTSLWMETRVQRGEAPGPRSRRSSVAELGFQVDCGTETLGGFKQGWGQTCRAPRARGMSLGPGGRPLPFLSALAKPPVLQAKFRVSPSEAPS